MSSVCVNTLPLGVSANCVDGGYLTLMPVHEPVVFTVTVRSALRRPFPLRSTVVGLTAALVTEHVEGALCVVADAVAHELVRAPVTPRTRRSYAVLGDSAVRAYVVVAPG